MLRLWQQGLHAGDGIQLVREAERGFAGEDDLAYRSRGDQPEGPGHRGIPSRPVGQVLATDSLGAAANSLRGREYQRVDLLHQGVDGVG